MKARRRYTNHRSGDITDDDAIPTYEAVDERQIRFAYPYIIARPSRCDDAPDRACGDD
jgi:hypothetical protein